MANVVVSLDSVLILQQKIDSSLQASGKTTFGRVLDMFPFPSTRESYGKTIALAWRLRKKRQVHFTNVPVYKGSLANNSLVAVKRLKEERAQGHEVQFQTEVEVSGMAVHRNLLSLQGFCMTPTKRLLVYPYMVNGNVASCLRDRPATQLALDWPVRKHIALGAARGLAYLHDHDPKIIHRDVKAANIQLDEKFEAVVGDFGLAKLMNCEDTHVTTAVRGTVGHLATEYLSTGKLSEKPDVFGYGMMLLELITKQRVFDLARLANDDEVMLLDWVKRLMMDKKFEILVDVDLDFSYLKDIEELIQIALLCTNMEPCDRPKMLEVVKMLEGDSVTAESLEDVQREEISQEDISHAHNPNIKYITLLTVILVVQLLTSLVRNYFR